MRFFIAGVCICTVAFTFPSAEGNQGNQDLHESQAGSADEMTLLQPRPPRKPDETKANSAKRQAPICIELEAHLEFEAFPEPLALAVPSAVSSANSEVLVAPKALSSTVSEELAAPKDVPAPALPLLVLRVAFWLVSFATAAFFALRAAASGHVGEDADPTDISLGVGASMLAKTDADPMAVAPQRALHEAALAGEDMRCQSLLDMAVLMSGAKPLDVISAANAWGATALHAAAMSGACAVLDLFLEHGSHVDPVDYWEETPLHLAARAGHVGACEFLVVRGASLGVVNSQDMTPLVVAAHAGHEPTCDKLLEMGAGVGGLSEEQLPDMLRELMLANLMARAMAGPSFSAAS